LEREKKKKALSQKAITPNFSFKRDR